MKNEDEPANGLLITLAEFLYQSVGLDLLFEELLQPKVNLDMIVQLINQHKRSSAFQNINQKVKLLEEEYKKERNVDVRHGFTTELLKFSQNIHHRWRAILLRFETEFQRIQNIRETFEAHFAPIFQTLFVAVTFLFRYISRTFSSQQSLAILHLYGWLEFLSVAFPVYDEVVTALLANISWEKRHLASPEQGSSIDTELVGLFDPSSLNDPKAHPLDLTRLYFALSVFQRFSSDFPDCVLQDTVIPNLFIGMQHYDDALKKYCHSVFATLFSVLDQRLFLLEILPNYLSSSLQFAYTPFDLFEQSCLQMATHFPEPRLSEYENCMEIITNHLTKVQSQPCLFLLFKLLNVTPFPLLDKHMKRVEDLLQTYPQWLNPSIAIQLRQILVDDFDFTRKTKCLHWYLDLINKFQIKP